MKKRKFKARSGFEGRVANNELPRGAQYETDKLPYIKHHKYIPDFTLPNGIFVEAKGYFIASDRTKLLAVRDQNPGVEIRILFQDASKFISKGSKTTYGEWATKHGFTWAQGERVPTTWYEEI